MREPSSWPIWLLATVLFAALCLGCAGQRQVSKTGFSQQLQGLISNAQRDGSEIPFRCVYSGPLNATACVTESEFDRATQSTR